MSAPFVLLLVALYAVGMSTLGGVVGVSVKQQLWPAYGGAAPIGSWDTFEKRWDRGVGNPIEGTSIRRSDDAGLTAVMILSRTLGDLLPNLTFKYDAGLETV